MPVAVIACQEVTLIARHFVEALQKRFDAIYCLDEGFRAALAETGTELRPLADLPDDDRLCAYFPRGHEWIDETFGRMIDDARARDTAAYLNKYQRGYCPLLTRDRALGERFLRHRNPIQMVAYLAGQRPGVHVSSAALDRIRPFYLDTTGEDGRRTLFYLIEIRDRTERAGRPGVPHHFRGAQQGVHAKTDPAAGDVLQYRGQAGAGDRRLSHIADSGRHPDW